MIVIARQISLVSAFLFTFLLFKILIIETPNRLGGVTDKILSHKKIPKQHIMAISGM